MTSLNPCYTVGFQIMEAIKSIRAVTRKPTSSAGDRPATERWDPDPASRLDVTAASAFWRDESACDDRSGNCLSAKLLIADEPTTALDVTIRAQIMSCCWTAAEREL